MFSSRRREYSPARSKLVGLKDSNKEDSNKMALGRGETTKQSFGTLPPLSHQRLPQVVGRGNLTLLCASPLVLVRPHGPIRPARVKVA